MLEQIETYFASATQSDFFAGGIALGIMGAAIAILNGAWQSAFRFVNRRVSISVTLDNRVGAYRHFCLWLDSTGVLSHARRVRVTEFGRSGGGTLFAPAPGRHWFFHSGRLCILDRTISAKSKVGGGYEQRPMETITVTVLFGRISLVQDWIDVGMRLERDRSRAGPSLHMLQHGCWEHLGDVPRRPIFTVLADDDRIERLLDDMRWFYGACDWYATRGVPWRRGYLLYGPPGTGKSSAIRALASELDRDIANLDIGRAGLSDDELREAMVTAPCGVILAIEDIDAIFRGREKGEKPIGVSFSGLLNAIDGVAAQEGRALIMTTNHRGRLDPALIRPGRADVQVELDLVGATTAAELFARFFPGQLGLAQQFKTSLGDLQIAPAALQGWLLNNTANPQAAASARGLLSDLTAVAAE